MTLDRDFRHLLTVACVLFGCVVGGRSESVLIFPRLANDPETITGVAIVNPRSETATVTITAYSESGKPVDVPGVQNPVQLEIAPGQQLAKLTSEFFGPDLPENTQGWFSVVSDSNDLSGFFTFLDLKFSIFDGAELSEAETEIIFDDVRTGEGFQTEINIVNTASAEAELQLQLVSESAQVTRDIVLPPMGSTRFDAAEFFGLGAEGGPSYVTVQADQEIVGFELVQGEGDLLGLNADPLQEPVNRIFFPQFAVLGGLSSRVSIANPSEQAVLLTVTAHKPDGTLYDQQDLQSNPITRVISADSFLVEEVGSMFGFSGSGVLNGWLEIQSSSASIHGSLSYSVATQTSLASVAAVGRGMTRGLFAHIATSLGFFTGIAALNPGSLSANMRIMAFTQEGTRLGTFSTVLRPGQQISQLLEEMIADAAGQAGGFVWVESDLPLYLTSIFGNPTTGVLANIPSQPVPESFDPSLGVPQTTLTPTIAILEPARSQVFQVQDALESPQWTVNGIDGGSPLVGQIDASGLYVAPALIPENLPISVQAVTGNQTVGASVDVLSTEDFRLDLGVIQSVAYSSGLARLFAAELSFGASPAGTRSPSGGVSTRILDVTSAEALSVTTLTGEDVTAMLPFQGSDARDYLLVASTSTGRILRIDPTDGSSVEVASGLDQPAALVIDKVDSSLLVAEATQVSAIDAASLNVGLEGAGPQGSAGLEKLLEVAASRIAIDDCTGNILVSRPAAGEVNEFVRLTGSLRLVAQDLARPRGLLGFYRRAVSCPQSFHLLVQERDADAITLVVPSTGQVRRWIDVSDVVDLTFLPVGNPLVPEGGVVIATDDEEGGSLSLIRLPSIYWDRGLNPPKRITPSKCRLAQITRTQGENRFPVISDDGRRVILTSDSDPLGTNPENNRELFRFDVASGDFEQLTDTVDAEVGPSATDLTGSLVAYVAFVPTGETSGENRLYVLPASGPMVEAPGVPLGPPAVDDSGMRVAYVSADDPLEQNPDGNPEIFLLEPGGIHRQNTQTTSGLNGPPVLSGDGQWLTFLSTANIAGLNPQGDEVVYLREIGTGDTVLPGGVRSSQEDLSGFGPLIDEDGTTVLFSSYLDLTGQNPNGRRALFLYEREEDSLVQLSDDVMLSDLGDFSHAGDLVAVATNRRLTRLNRDTNREIFLTDVTTGESLQVTRSIDITNRDPSMSADASLIVFRSNANYSGRNADANFEVYLAECRLDRP